MYMDSCCERDVLIFEGKLTFEMDIVIYIEKLDKFGSKIIIFHQSVSER